MELNYTAFISFVLITSFTPGPNNIACASFAMLMGYKKTLKFILGVVAGFVMILSICALLSNLILLYAPFFNTYVKYAGAVYIGWLAYQTLKAGYSSDGQLEKFASFGRGMMLQLVNPKGLFYAMTVFTTFLAGGGILQITPWIIFLGGICFTSISVWALFGNMIQKYMQNAKHRQAINIALASALFLTALQIADVF